LPVTLKLDEPWKLIEAGVEVGGGGAAAQFPLVHVSCTSVQPPAEVTAVPPHVAPESELAE
jgi:hypothetical protein